MELRKIVKILTATIVLGTLASSGALILITSYLHRLAGQIDNNLQSVRAAEEIQLHLLWHARSTNARRIVIAHGGAIDVRSVVGRGSTFTISLPADVAVVQPRARAG